MSGFDNDVVYAKNADFTQVDNQNVSEANGLATNGQMWIGTTATNAGGTHVNVGNLTSPDSSVTVGYSSPNITLQVAGGSTVGKTITGNTGGALSPTVGNWNILTGHTTVKFAGSGSTLLLDFAIAQGNLFLGSAGPNIVAGADRNVALGALNLDALTTGTDNTAIGNSGLQALTTGSRNTILGSAAGNGITTSADNTAVGVSSLLLFSTGAANAGANTAIGHSALSQLSTGVNNTALGESAGSAYTLANSSNIAIGNVGLAGESNAIRIGTQGSGTGQQNKNFQAGISGVTVAASAPVAVASTGQLSSLGFGTATQVLTSNGAGVSPTWQAAGGASSVVFKAYLSASQSNVTGNGTQYKIPYDSIFYDSASAFNTTTNEYVIPETGVYLFTVNNYVFGSAPSTASIMISWLSINGSAYPGIRFDDVNPGGLGLTANVEFIINSSTPMAMTAGDTISVFTVLNGAGVDNCGITGTATGGSYFSGFKLP